MTKYKVHTKKWKSCVRKVRTKNPNVNEYSVCTHSLGKSKSYKMKK